MAIYNDLVVTNAGIALLQNVLVNPTTNAQRMLVASKNGMVTSETVIKDEELSSLIAIKAEKQKLAYSLYKDPSNSNQIVLEGRLTNKDVTAAYRLNTIVFFAGNGLAETGTDPFRKVLFAVIRAKEPDVIPDWDTHPVNLNFRAVIALDNAEKVAVYATYNGEITADQVHAIVAEHDVSYTAHRNLFSFYNLMSLPNTKYTTSGLGTSTVTERITTADTRSRLIAENITEKKTDGWQVKETLYDYSGTINRLIQTRTTTYKKVGNEWEATVV